VIVRYSAVFLPNPSRIGVLSWCWRVVLYLIHILLLLYIILYIILYSSNPLIYTLLPLPFPLFFSPPLLIHPSLSSLHLFSSSSILLWSISFLYNPSQYSFYTCRYLHILIYILSQYSNPPPSKSTIRPRTFYRSGWLRCDVFNYVVFGSVWDWAGVLVYVLTPHVLSEWMVEVWCWEWYRLWLFWAFEGLSWWMLLVFRSDCKVFGCISSKSEQNWCFELVDVIYVWAGVDVWCLGYYYIIYYYYYILYIYYYIIYYTILLLYLILYSSSSPLLSFPSSSSSFHSILVGTYIYLFISHPNNPIFLFSKSDPARSIGVDGWGVMCLIVWCSVLVDGYCVSSLSVWH
jgi:hypothetical protein